MEPKKIEKVEGGKGVRKRGLVRWVADETMVKRLFTGYDRTDYLSCQYIKWVLVFKDWAQNQMGI